MESRMKNMVVLKSLPSNIVEEAIIVLKENVKIEEKQKKVKIRDKNLIGGKEEKNEKEYILKEAEMIVNNYVSQCENKNTNVNYLKIKRLFIFSSIIAILELLIICIK